MFVHFAFLECKFQISTVMLWIFDFYLACFRPDCAFRHSFYADQVSHAILNQLGKLLHIK